MLAAAITDPLRFGRVFLFDELETTLPTKSTKIKIKDDGVPCGEFLS